MLRACYLLKDSINKIQRMGKSISQNSDLDVLKTRIRFEYRNATVFINELLSILYDSSDIDQAQDELISFYTTVMDSDDWQEIKAEVTSIDTRVLGYYIDNLNRSDLISRARNYDSSSLDINRMDLRDIAPIFKSPTGRPITILDAGCKTGSTMEHFKQLATCNLDAYGMEIDPSYANIAKSKNVFTKIAKGGLKGTKCSNNVFDIGYFFPELHTDAVLTQMGTLKPRKEFEDLKRITNYIRYDGLLLFVVPYFRLTTQMCNYISKAYKDVNIYRMTEWNSLVLLTAVKKIYNQDGDEEIYNSIRQVSLSVRNAKDLSEVRELNIELPPSVLAIETFRGNILDDEDIKEIVDSTSLYDNFMKKQADILDNNDNKRPLLPFNLGQIGLVLTSGCLDGTVEEVEDQCHVIKGMVKKEELVQEIQGDKEGDKETITTNVNKVQIKIITPDGNLKTLA